MKNQSIKYKVARKEALIPLSASLFIIIILIGNFVLNMLLHLGKNIFSELSNPRPFSFSADYFFHLRIGEHPIFFFFLLIIATISTLKFVYEVRSNFKDLNENQKGSSRFTELTELKDQYKAVPDRTHKYKGGGGVVISSYKDKLFVDDSAVNNLIIGTTRSGKGETFVFPTIDTYSRAEHQPSLILNDPKGELFAASKDTLINRGYHIEVLNLLNPTESMSYNLLQLIKDAYKDGDYSTAQTLCNTLSHSLYYNPNAKDPMWQNSAMSLCNAMILAITEKCINEGTEEKITMYAVANMLSDLGSKEIYDEKGELQNALDMYFQKLPSNNVAKMQYATSNFAKGNTRSGIFTQTMSALSIFTFDEIAKMTARNSIDLKRIGFGKAIKGKGRAFKNIEVIFPDNSKENVKTDKAGSFELNFKKTLRVGDEVKLLEKEEGHETVIRITEIIEKTGETKIENVIESEAVVVKEVQYFNKPVALFMITPDFDSSNHVIASIFVRQLYFVLAKNASLARGGKCHREVVFILDEFGNMPSIEGMANIVTVCLGRNIRFNLIIQAYAQLKNKYGEDAPTIDGNCGNTIYILTNDYDTAKKISEKLGDRTINSVSRSGQTLSFNKSKTESVDNRNLLTPNELMSLKEGESVVIRVIKRQDNKRNRIRPYPIYNHEKTALKYRWEYLQDDFDTDKSILDVTIDSMHRDVDPLSLMINFNKKEEREKEQPKESNTNEEVPYIETEKIPQWKKLSVEEFFTNNSSFLDLIENQIAPKLERNIDEIKKQKFADVWEEIKLLGMNDEIDKAIYRTFSGKVKKIIEELNDVDTDQAV